MSTCITEPYSIYLSMPFLTALFLAYYVPNRFPKYFRQTPKDCSVWNFLPPNIYISNSPSHLHKCHMLNSTHLKKKKKKKAYLKLLSHYCVISSFLCFLFAIAFIIQYLLYLLHITQSPASVK